MRKNKKASPIAGTSLRFNYFLMLMKVIKKTV